MSLDYFFLADFRRFIAQIYADATDQSHQLPEHKKSAPYQRSLFADICENNTAIDLGTTNRIRLSFSKIWGSNRQIFHN